MATLVLAGVLIGIGRWSAQRGTPAAVAVLQGEVDSLRAENAQVALLANRMADLETSYSRLRAVMSGEVEPSARDILLPLVPSRLDRRGPRETGGSVPAVWPLVEAGFITRAFGDSVPGEEPHVGLDIAVPVGSYVRSTGSGRVLEAAEDSEYGRFVRVEHDEELTALYAHNSWTFVAAGDSVEAGEVIALSGNSGRSSAPHLHLEITRRGEAVDPLPFVSGRL
jgi:murein DD-endopeptidase MepM/ murein hydrolase activator NlpD